MSAAVLSIGTEITRGEIVNTNAAWLSTELTSAGFSVGAVEAVPDEVDVIIEALRRLGSAHRILVVTGGLGPTTDDLTALAAARATGVELARDESSLLAIRRRLEARGLTMNPSNEKQADVPAGAEILPNQHGTAPGFALPMGSGTAFFMPGVPKEMKPMFSEMVLPRIRSSASNNAHQIVLHVYGLRESAIGEALGGVEAAYPGLTLGYRVHFPECDVKVHVRAATQATARDVAQKAAEEVKERLGDVVYGEGEDAFPEVVGRAVRNRGYRLALAESCTGGLVSHLLTSYPASDYLVGGAVTYANSAKTRLLGVQEDTLRGHGAVSAEVAAEMAEGARRMCECDIGVGITGIAGPTGGSAAKPVGLVYWAVSSPHGTIVRDRVFPGDRDEVRRAAAYAALDLVRRVSLGIPVK